MLRSCLKVLIRPIRSRSINLSRFRVPSLRVAIILPILCLSLSTALMANHDITNKKVKARVALMATQKEALTILTDMAAGRSPFNSKSARRARNVLIENTGDIRKHFKKPHHDPHSQAKPLIWQNWRDFEYRAKMANKAARQLKTGNASNLRSTLPAMIQRCLNCHQTYRRTDQEFTTH